MIASPHIASVFRMMVATGILPPATLVLPCTSALDRYDWMPLWSENGSELYHLSEEPVQVRLNKPAPEQAAGQIECMLLRIIRLPMIYTSRDTACCWPAAGLVQHVG
jgi:hypothetical protein